MLRSTFSFGLLALLAACATDVEQAPIDDTLEIQDVEVRGNLGTLLPNFERELDGLAQRHGLPDVRDLRALRAEVDELGITHVRVQQTVGGVPVWGGEAIVHLDAQRGDSHVTDELRAELDLDTTPTLDASLAEEAALEQEPGGALTDAESTLYVMRRDEGDFLVWQVDLDVLDAAGALIAKPRLFVDAHTGELVWSYDNMKTGTGGTHYDGVQTFSTTTWSGWFSYQTLQTTDVITTSWANTTTSTTTPYDWDGWWTDSEDLSAVSAHWAAAETLAYLYAWHGWNGWDGAGSRLNVYTDYGSGWNNASGGGGGIWFGDGDGSSWSSFASVDIVAHEVGHNLTEKMANLVYSGESGGMNESFSDLLGVMGERWVDGGTTDNWRVGEDPYTPSVSGDALRYMSDPAADGWSADYYTSAAAIGAMDVHGSSGIGNLAFSLLANGGYHPRRSSTYTYGVGADAAMWIAFRAYRYYLTSTSDYADLREAMTLAAADGYGATSWVVDSVESAFNNVGVGTTGCETGYLEGAGYGDSLPGGTYFYSATGAVSGDLIATSGANVGLYLYKWNGSAWAGVAGSASGSGEQAVSYSGGAGYYLFYAYSHSGASNYSFCMN